MKYPNWEKLSKVPDFDCLRFMAQDYHTLCLHLYNNIIKNEDRGADELVAAFTQLMEDKPFLRETFDRFLDDQPSNTIWSDQDVILRFVNRIAVYSETQAIHSFMEACSEKEN